MLNKSRSIYIHWPFCLSKCPYCDFNSHINSKNLDIESWLEAYKIEIHQEFQNLGKTQIKSIFFGGGTPSLMPLKIIDFIINFLAKNYSFSDKFEITLEANPSSSESKNFRYLSEIGINRLSLGLQSLNNDSLLFLGRNHNASEGIKALENAKRYFNNISFDLIYGLPEQTEKKWEKELLETLKFSHNHISAYQLTIEKGTPFFSLHKKNHLILPSEKILLNLYNMTDDILSNNKFNKYEVSNYAITGAESIHNINVWEGNEYSGFGPGAHGRIITNNSWYSTYRYASPYIWLNKTLQKQNSLLKKNIISSKERAKEILLTSLRLLKGADLINIKSLCNLPSLNLIVNKNNCLILEKEKFITINKNVIKVTNKGFPLLNSVINKIII